MTYTTTIPAKSITVGANESLVHATTNGATTTERTAPLTPAAIRKLTINRNLMRPRRAR